MQDFSALFRNKKITLLGLGLLGRGVGDAAFLAECGAVLTVVDKKDAAQLAPSLEKLKKFSGIKFHLGESSMEDFTTADMVIKAAGIPLDSREIAAAKAADVPVYMSTALFAKYAMEIGAKIVGVTGTRGKSTTTQMIYHSLIRANKKVLLGGNIRGVSTLAQLPLVTSDTIVVLELDSWQLQGFGDLKMSPHVAVFTNLMPDHMNYYNGDMEAYFNDKANIFRFQQGGNALFVGEQIFEKVLETHPPAAPQVPAPLKKEWHLKVVGEHNRSNAALAAAALHSLGLSEEEIQRGLESFEAVEGRLQFVREVGGIKIYNDNNATTPEATIAALRALDGKITLITGGSEKGLDLSELVKEVQARVTHIILLKHSNYKGSERFASVLGDAGISFAETVSLEDAVDMAMQSTTEGTILFSPAFASFGMFNNEYERNDEFLRLVRAL